MDQHLNEWLEADYDLDLSNEYRMICEGTGTTAQTSQDDVVASFFIENTNFELGELEDNNMLLSTPTFPEPIAAENAKPESDQSTLCNESDNPLIMALLAEVMVLKTLVIESKNMIARLVEHAGLPCTRGEGVEEILF